MTFPTVPVVIGAGLAGLWWWNKKKNETKPQPQGATFQANIPYPSMGPASSAGQPTVRRDPATGTVVSVTPGTTVVPVPGGSITVPAIQVTTSPPASANADMLVVTTHDDGPAGDLNVRVGPGTAYHVIGRAPKGSWVKRVGPSQNGFANITTQDGAVVGWAAEMYLSPVGPQGSPA